MRLVLTLLLPADARFLPRTRRAIAGYLEESGACEEVLDDVVLALDEACANVIRHAFPDGIPTGTLKLHAEILDDSVMVQVEDDGVGFDPCRVGLAAGHEATSGRGLEMIRHLMTSVEVESPTPSGGTRLVMHKDLNTGNP
jgi:serine/threonine-protein kinase RsbW